MKGGFTSEPFGTLKSSVVDVKDARTLPPWCYTSEQFFRFEQEAVFARRWFAVTHERMLPDPGDFLAVDVAGEPMIVVRDQHGSINVLSAVCRHRGCVLLTGSGNCGKTIVCPYHRWSYGLDGQLLGAPYMTRTHGFDKSAIRLHRLATTVWQGFVFANFDTTPPEFDVPTDELEHMLANYQLADSALARPTSLTLDWNWKVMLENAVECYHCTATHGQLHETAPTKNSTASPLSEMAGAFASRVRNTWPDSDFTATGTILFPQLPGLDEEQRSHSTWLIVPPNLFLSLQHDNVHYFLVRPIAADRTLMEVGYLYPPATTALADFDERFDSAMSWWLPIIDQDNEINRRVQKGLSSRFAPRGRYSWLEEALVGFNRWLVDCYQSAASDDDHLAASMLPLLRETLTRKEG
jgi:phenylpropionate dioxygenase-like ring-hydroxylating dioxygenase large terminal subunit